MRTRAYWDSFKLYLRAVLGHWVALFIFIGAGSVGLAQEYWTSLALPPWAWFSIAAAALVVAQFRAFHDVRIERDDARAVAAARADQARPRLNVTVPSPHLMPFVPPESGSGKYATIDVETSEAVTGCAGHITKIVTEGIDVPVRAPIPLRWIAYKALRRDLVPGIPYGMTVVFAESGRPTEFLISTDTHEPRGIPWALRPGISLLTIVVSADNVPPCRVEVRVDATNDWRLLDMKAAAEYERETEDRWAVAHPYSAALGLQAGGTGPFDDVREEQLREDPVGEWVRQMQERAARTGTTAGTISFPPYTEEDPPTS